MQPRSTCLRSRLLLIALSVWSGACLSKNMLTGEDADGAVESSDGSVPDGSPGADAAADGSAPPADGAPGDAAVDAEAAVDDTERCFSQDVDPLLGLWYRKGNPEETCEFFSNGRFTEGCGLDLGDPFEWAQLDDGRYFFNATNAFGSIVEVCTAKPSFGPECDTLTLTVDCGQEERELKLVRGDR